MENYNIILFVITFLVLYLIYCDYNKTKEINSIKNTTDSFSTDATTTSSGDINKLIENLKEDLISKIETKVETYVNSYTTERDDIPITESIKNLGLITKKIQNSDGFTFPSNLNVTGKFNLLPAGTIVMWGKIEIPDGWVECNGEYNTPDLRGRFVLGSGQGSVDGMTNRTLKEFGPDNGIEGDKDVEDTGIRNGGEIHKLTIAQIPSHKHLSGYYRIMDTLGGGSGTGRESSGAWGSIFHTDNTTLNTDEHSSKEGRDGGFNRPGGDGVSDRCDPFTRLGNCNHDVMQDYSQPIGGGQSHNNMPPYYVLVYIMKIY